MKSRTWHLGAAAVLVATGIFMGVRSEVRAQNAVIGATTAASDDERAMYVRLAEMVRSEDRDLRAKAHKFLYERRYSGWKGTEAQLRELRLSGLKDDVIEDVAWALSEQDVGWKVLAGETGSDDWRVRLWAKAGLARNNLEVGGYVNELKAALESEKLDRIDIGCRTAALAGERAVAAGLVLSKVLARPDSWIRYRAATAIADVGASEPEVLAALVRTLDDKEAGPMAVAALTRLGAKAKAVVPELVKRLSARNDLRYGIVLALGKIDPRVPEALPVLRQLLRESLNKERQPDEQVILALGAYGPAAKEAVPELIEAMQRRGDHPYYVGAAIWALGQIGPDARVARDEVRKLVDTIWGEGAKWALKRIEATDPATMPAAEERYTGWQFPFKF